MALYISRKDNVHTITIHGRKVAHPTLPKVQTQYKLNMKGNPSLREGDGKAAIPLLPCTESAC